MKRMREDQGSSLPLLIFISAFTMISAMLLANIQQAAIGDMRVADYAQSLALAAARDGAEAAESAERVIEDNEGLDLEVNVATIDSKTFAATVCISQPLVFDLFGLRQQTVCERRMARWLVD
jgi:hypothetical protein